jgi:DNA repair protein RecN (Recombination protein N)
MLAELCVRNLAVIEELRLEFKPGLTIALVEGVFWTSPEDNGLTMALQEAGIELDSDGSLILAREIRENGRSAARINGRAVPVSLLQELGHHLMDIHSQLEHVSLLSAQRQMDVLDSFAGLLEDRARLRTTLGGLRQKTRELSALADQSAARRRDLLEYQVAEIDEAGVSPGEDETLERERQVLERALTLQEGCHRACDALYNNDRSAASLIHEAAAALRGIVSIDTALAPHLEALESAAAEMEETARELRCYAESIESRSEQLEEIEKRLELLRHLKSKYGPALADVIGFADQARQELETLAAEDDRQRGLEEECRQLERELGDLAEKLSAARREAARGLTELVNRELADLGMDWAKFDIALRNEESVEGLPMSGGTYMCNHNGVDRAEFLGATNPGEPLRPLADIASGGETCRFMLALKSALQEADPVPTLFFDEIDAGIGGRNAHTIGRKLATLARDRQVICITHLPQIACFGQEHFRVRKGLSSGRAATRAELLEGDSRLEELASMLGRNADGSMLEGARQLLRCAEIDQKNCLTVAG